LKSVFCRAQNFLSTLLTLAALQGEQFAQRAQTFALAGVLLPEEGLQIFLIRSWRNQISVMLKP